MKQRLQSFMLNRRGMDELNKVLGRGAVLLLLCSAVLSLLHFIPHLSAVMNTLGWILLAAFLLRFLSRNITARDAENYAWLNSVAKRNNEREAAKERRNQKEYRFFKCPGCGQWLRVPKGKGKIHINCKCGYILYRRT